jgi:exodeoxyribonuclease VII large subunit
VGHETDTTLIDFVSDRRAPTPTAAAELAVPVRLDLMAWVDGQGARLWRCTGAAISQRRQRLSDLARALPKPAALLDGPRQRLDILADRLPVALTHGVQRRRLHLSEISGSLRPGTLRRMIAADRRRVDDLAARLDPAMARLLARRTEALTACAARVQPRQLRTHIDREALELQRLGLRFGKAAQAQVSGWRTRIAAVDRLRETLSYKATLARGYAVVRAQDQVVTTKQAAEQAGALEIEFIDGRLKIGGTAPRRSRKSTPEQGTLL